MEHIKGSPFKMVWFPSQSGLLQAERQACSMTHHTSKLRWTARIWSVASLLFLFLIFAGQAGSGNRPLELHEWVGLTLFPGGVCIGLMIAFFRERPGGVVTISSLAGFYIWHYVVGGDLPGGPVFVLLAAPGALWLACVHLAASDAKDEQRTVSPDKDGGTAHAVQRAGSMAVIVTSMHHDNTLRVARAMAEELDATLFTPEQAIAEDLTKYHLVGFGSGIYFGRHHRALTKLVRNITQVPQNVSSFQLPGFRGCHGCFTGP